MLITIRFCTVAVKNHRTIIISKNILSHVETHVNCWRCLESRNTYSDLQHVQLFHTQPCWFEHDHQLSYVALERPSVRFKGSNVYFDALFPVTLHFTVKRSESDRFYGFPAFLHSHHFCVYLNWLILVSPASRKINLVMLDSVKWSEVFDYEERSEWRGKIHWKRPDMEDTHEHTAVITHQSMDPTTGQRVGGMHG